MQSKRLPLYLGVLLLGLLVLVGCNLPRRVTNQPLPDRDIVFQTTLSRRARDKRIGFIDADGSGLTFVAITHVHTSIHMSPRPFWTSDGQMVFFSGRLGGAFLGIRRDGLLRKYPQWMALAAPLEQPNLTILLAAIDDVLDGIALFDLDTGQIIHTYVVEEGDHPSIGTSALSGSMLVYRRGWRPDPVATPGLTVMEIVLLDIDTGEEVVLARREGQDSESYLDRPAISPDGQWVVYTAAEGLRLVRPDGSDDHLLVPMDLVREDAVGKRLDVAPPDASWSPDSHWLVYHRCMLPSPKFCYDSVQDHAIFKLNIETREETLLVEGGVSPYWRLAPSGAAEERAEATLAVEALDRSTPDTVILALYEAINSQDVALFGEVCAVDSEAQSVAEQSMSTAIETGIRYEIRDIEWDVVSHDGDMLRVDTRYRETITMGENVLQEMDSGDWLTLIHKNGAWYVVCLQP